MIRKAVVNFLIDLLNQAKVSKQKRDLLFSKERESEEHEKKTAETFQSKKTCWFKNYLILQLLKIKSRLI